MTHTLHPEIEKTIQRLVNRIKQDVVTWKEDDVYWLIIWYLWPYLLPPSQHLKDEPTDMKHHRSILLGWDKWAGGWDMSCDVYWYYRDWKFYITNIEHSVEDNEPLPEKDLSWKIIDWLNKLYVEEELKQSTPKIEKIWDFKDLYAFPSVVPRIWYRNAGYIRNGENWLEEWYDYMKFNAIKSKLNEVIDYINNKD